MELGQEKVGRSQPEFRESDIDNCDRHSITLVTLQPLAMSGQTSNPPIPPIPQSPVSIGGSVRRHHTISAASRSARAAARESISEEVADQPFSNEDEPVDEDWVGGVGAVGEKTSLHRQSSLPTKYHRGMSSVHSPCGPCLTILFALAFGSRAGNKTPKTVNSLAAITGHEGDEEPWNIGNYSVQGDDVCTLWCLYCSITCW